MKTYWIAAFCFLLFTVQCSKAEDAELKTQREKISYSIGMNLGTGLKKQAIDVDPDLVAQGIKDILAGGKTLLTEDQAKEALKTLENELTAKEHAEMAKTAEKNKKDGEDFLAQNKTKEGVVTLPSGLQYKVIKAGTGPKPKLTDTVATNYRGTFIDGTEFDASAKHGGPATFRVNGVIQGWSEALQLMEVGAKWQLFVPSNLAYGERGAGDVIGPNTALIFEVELLEIKSQ